MIEFVDPRAEPATPVEPYEQSFDVESDSLDIGLLANGFPDSVEFLDAVGDALERRLPNVRLHKFNKGNASIVAPDDLVEGISKTCKAVVAAYGH